jgi:hypothetical protein
LRQVLYALHIVGRMAVYRKGVDYLLRTQAADGTWHVKDALHLAVALLRKRVPLSGRATVKPMTSSSSRPEGEARLDVAAALI